MRETITLRKDFRVPLGGSGVTIDWKHPISVASMETMARYISQTGLWLEYHDSPRPHRPAPHPEKTCLRTVKAKYEEGVLEIKGIPHGGLSGVWESDLAGDLELAGEYSLDLAESGAPVLRYFLGLYIRRPSVTVGEVYKVEIDLNKPHGSWPGVDLSSSKSVDAITDFLDRVSAGRVTAEYSFNHENEPMRLIKIDHTRVCAKIVEGSFDAGTGVLRMEFVPYGPFAHLLKGKEKAEFSMRGFSDIDPINKQKEIRPLIKLVTFDLRMQGDEDVLS